MKHKRVKTVISLAIALFLVLEIIPMNALAVLSTSNMSANIYEMENYEAPNIVAEVVEERDAFSKVYLLEDGSYYSVTTYAPIHEMKNGKWEDVENLNVDVEDVESIDDAQTILRTISSEQFENNVDNVSAVNALSNNANQTDNSSLVYNIINGEENNGIISLCGWGALVAKPTSLYNYANRNKLIIKAYVNADCVCSDFHYASEVSVYEMTDSWNETSDLTSCEFELEPLIDTKVIEISGDGTYSWDITDVYSKWDKGVKTNNGFILGTSSIDCDISLSSICISVIYRDIDENDALSTYHTVDMGRAGSIYINDLTNTVKLEQDILKIPRTVMPIYLKRIYNLSDVFDGESNGFRWNYESTLKLKDGLVYWKTFDGTVKHFVQSDPNVVSGEYTKWCLVAGESSANPQDTSLWVKTDEMSNSVYDYSNFYIISNNIKYNFNTSGKMILMGIRNDENNSISFNYTNDILTSISYVNSDIFTSIQISKINNSKTIVQITSNNLVTNEVSYNEIVNIETSVENYITKNKVVYNDGKSVEYEFDYEQKLTSVKDENGTKLQLIFYDDSSEGDRLLSYQKSSDTTEYYEDMYFDDADTYRRYYWNSNSENQEMIQYDRDFRVVSHQDGNGKYTFASYDENGIVNSYVVSGEAGTEKLSSCAFEDGNRDRMWGKRGNVAWIEYANNNNVPVPENGGNIVVFMSTNDKTADTTTLSQNVTGLSPNTTYVFGAWIYVENALATGDITISATNQISNESFEVEFDPTAVGCWQYNLMACKFSNEGRVKFEISLKNQVGDIYVDNATLYEATSASVDLLDTISVSPFEIIKNADGSVDKEIITDGITSLVRSYTYDENQISSITDMNGITTYYGYDSDTGTLNEIGTIKDDNGNIINPTELVSTITGLPTYIKQNVTNISNNQNVEMTATYTYDSDDRVSSITHNGTTYNYQYDSENLIKITKDNIDLIEYDFNNEGIGQINYCNGVTINYSYENGFVTEIEITKNNSTYKKYVYCYDLDNKIDYILETTDNIKIDYLNDGFEIYSLSNSSAIPIYKNVVSSDGVVTEKYYPDVFSDKSDNLKDKNFVVKTTSKSEKYVDVNTGETTKTSTQTINKIVDWNSDTDYNESIYTLNRSSVADYFGRISEKITEINSNVDDSQIKVSEKYVYKDLTSTITSTTVSSHTSRIDVLDSNGEAVNIVNDKMYYEYDEAGNIVFEYQIVDNNIVPINYYEYDEANQLIGEYNVKSNVCSTYTYDNGGNITKKIYHDVNTVTCNSDIHRVENYGTVINSVTYSYDVDSKDLLTEYNGINILYDNYGNPLNYFAESYETSALNASSSIYAHEYSVSGTCEWTGKYLTAFETESNRFTYDYNEDGYRIKKTVMDKNENGTFDVVQEIIYIWNSDKLSGIVYRNINNNSDGTTSISSTQADIIYDQEGEAVGFVFADELEWYFIKDLNGSVNGIVSSSGTKIATITYDAWGLPSICFNIDVTTQLGKAQYVILSLTVPLNPISYKGYLYDYETGLYFSQDKVYSPAWGRYLNPVDYEDKSNPIYSTTNLNMYSFCNNNPVNIFDPYSYAAAIRVSEFDSVSEVASGFDIQTNEAFLSQVFCGVFANSIIKKFGTWEYSNGSTAYGMDAKYIAQNLFAHNIAKYRITALNAVNSSWGDGWASQVALNDSIKVYKNDAHRSDYEMIWNAGYLFLKYI